MTRRERFARWRARGRAYSDAMKVSRCQGDVANSGPPANMDYDICFRDDCSGSECAAVLEWATEYQRLLKLRGLA